MVEVEEMTAGEAQDLLKQVGYGHLGCAREGRPYVLPIHYAYGEHDIYIFTTEGMKTDYIAANPEVCLQVEEVLGPTQWRSVIVFGQAARLTRPEELEHAMQFITDSNPTLTPAINKTWLDVWGRANVVAIYRINPGIISGRKTLAAGETRGSAGS
jgi:nitroimidazol reductase NimA-like FMN-containing flavoprotein (pyridoxamine 5'-phosphate oxidase superfamily)